MESLRVISAIQWLGTWSMAKKTGGYVRRIDIQIILAAELKDEILPKRFEVECRV